MTDGVVDFELMAKNLHGKMKPVKLRGHVADIGAKCLINTAHLARQGYIIAQGMGKDGIDGSFMMDPDSGVVWPMSQDDHGMPILETDGAPIRVSSKPIGLITRFVEVAKRHKVTFTPITPKAHNASAQSSDASDMPDLEETTTDGESMSDDEAESSDEAELPRKAYTRRKQRMRPMIYKPKKFHELLHAGKQKTKETAVVSDALFNINGNIKRGYELTKPDLDEFDHAHDACAICKQAKMKAPPARKAAVHFDLGTATGRAD